MKPANLNRSRRAAIFIAIACLLLALPGMVSGYTALSGSEFVVYPSADWTEEGVATQSYVSFIPFYDNTEVLAWVIEDDGSETLIYNGTRDEAQAVDLGYANLITTNQTQATGPRWVHIISNRSGYVFVGTGGALRSPPARGGGFYDTHFIAHWPNSGISANPFVDICTHYNGTVNVTMKPIDAATGLYSGDDYINFTLNGTGNVTDPYCYHAPLELTGGNVANKGTTYIISATQGVFVLQHLDHIDTFNWLGAFDTGLLFGKVVVFATAKLDASASIYNPTTREVNCTLYKHMAGGAQAKDNTEGYFNFSDRAYVASTTLQPNDYGFVIWSGSDEEHLMLLCNESVSVVGGSEGEDHNLDNDKYDSHPYTRLPPVYGTDTLFETPFGMDDYNGGKTGSSWVIYQSSCDYPTVVDFYDFVNSENFGISDADANATICFDSVNAPKGKGLGIQAIATTVLFSNNDSAANSNMTVDCQAGTVSISENQVNLTDCQSTYDDYEYNATIELIDMNFSWVSGDVNHSFTIASANSSKGAVFGFNITGRVVLDWNAGTSCLHKTILWERGMFHISGTGGVQGTGYETGDDWDKGHIIRFNSSESVNPYRIAHATCSNCPIESAAPYVVTTLEVSDTDILVGDDTNITGTVTNHGSKEAIGTTPVHFVPHELGIKLPTMRIFFGNPLNYADVTDNVTITYIPAGSGESCNTTDIHNIYEPAEDKPVICVIETTVDGSPYPLTHIYFYLGDLAGAIGGCDCGEKLLFTYEAHLRYSSYLGWVSPTLNTNYGYCSPIRRETFNQSVEEEVQIGTPDQVIQKSVVPSSTNKTSENFTVTIEFLDLNPTLWMANVTIIDYYVQNTTNRTPLTSADVNMTYNCSRNATYTRYDRGSSFPITGYDNVTLNLTNAAGTVNCDTGFFTYINFSYVNNTYLQNITNYTTSRIVFTLTSNGTLPEGLINCVNITYSAVSENGSVDHDVSGIVCFSTASVGSAQITKTMNSTFLTAGDTVLINITFNSVQNYTWDYLDVGDDLPDFLNYTGNAWLYTVNSGQPDKFPDGVWGIGYNNWNRTNYWVQFQSRVVFLGTRQCHQLDNHH